LFRKWGGVVPEIAARKQVESMIPVLTDVIKGFEPKDIDTVAVTHGPGLIGSLLVGVETAKTLSFAWNKPLIPVNHVIAHMYANFVAPGSDLNYKGLTPTYPAISLVVSGGHTELFLMKDEKTIKWLGGTLDDAAGEAFDKTARLLGFENGGGQSIEAAASKFHPEEIGVKFQIKLPRPMLHDKSLNFSFSGLKTAVQREWKKQNIDSIVNGQLSNVIGAFAHEIQEAITDVLVYKTVKAAELYKAKSILVSGGVAANSRLREKVKGQLSNVKCLVPPKELCTDNAVMIATCAYYQNNPVEWEKVSANPGLSVEI